MVNSKLCTSKAEYNQQECELSIESNESHLGRSVRTSEVFASFAVQLTIKSEFQVALFQEQ